MFNHHDLFSKTRLIISGSALSLFLISSGAQAVNTGPACQLPAPGGLTVAGWVDNQTNAGGHMATCHIGQTVEWLEQRTVAGQPGCQQTDTATAWNNADDMWAAIGQDIQTFCTGPAINQNRYVINTNINGRGPAVVGIGFEADVGAFNINNTRTAITVLQRHNGNWHVLTGYPQ